MDAITFDLPKSLDITVIAPYFEEISSSISELNENTKVTLDAQQLINIDTTGLQLLVALVMELTSRNIAIEWANVPLELTDGAQGLGLSQILKMH